ncbi:MAG: hypothetical protein L0228_06065 [Planctomycetes bacterium]|nr:hypothetical protein [Planctomycetota bacterium]
MLCRYSALLLVPLVVNVAKALPPNVPEQHVYFDNSAADGSYFHSEATVVAPSELQVVNGKFPVEDGRFVSPSNCLRLTWKSAPGGDWRMTLKVTGRYGRRFQFAGDTLSMWLFSTEELTPETGPRIFLQDANGAGVPTILLLAHQGRLPANRWVHLRLPFAKFRGQYGGTDDGKFDSRQLAGIAFVQNLEDDKQHTLYIDDVSVIDGNASDSDAPSTPTGLTVEGQARHFDLSWQPCGGDDLKCYRVYRSWDGQDFQPVATRPAWSCRHVDFVDGPGKRAHYKVSAIDVHDNESPPSTAAEGTTRDFDDEQLLDMVQEGCFRYYWDAANADSGMAVEILPGDSNLVAVGASGFGIMAQIVATERKFITRDESARRMLKILRFLKRADRFHGVWPHFLDGRTGRVNPYFGKYDNGGDLVETAFLVQGLLAARQYFDRDNDAERELRDTITSLWRDVEWDWYRKTPDSDVLFWHWSPDHEWHISHPLIGWNETMIVYLLAIASPTHPVPASLYHTGWAGQSELAVQYRRNWSRTADGEHFTNGNEYYGIKLDVGIGTGGDLFFTQFSFLGFDPRNKRDRYTNYFHNNRNIALINRAYCIDNPRNHVGYGPDCWGLSAGVNSGGGQPQPRGDNGTICSSAALGSFPYTPDESMAALNHFYYSLGPKIWGPYGFHDGFNQTQNWFDEVYMGLNQAQIVVGIENQRTGLVWKKFMANSEISGALQTTGFHSDGGSEN